MNDIISKLAASFKKHLPLLTADNESAWDLAGSLVSSINVNQLQSSSLPTSDCKFLTLKDVYLDSHVEHDWTTILAGVVLIESYVNRNEEVRAISELVYAIGDEMPNNSSDITTDSKYGPHDRDTYFISMYSLQLLKRVTDENLARTVISACFDSIMKSVARKGAGIITESKPQEIRGLIILSALIAKGPDASVMLPTLLYKNALEYLLTSYDIMTASSGQSRVAVSKMLLLPLLSSLAGRFADSDKGLATDNRADGESDSDREVILQSTWDHIMVSDLEGASMLLCTVLSLPFDAIVVYGSSRHASGLWRLVQDCFLSTDPVLRKRAAFVLQKIPQRKSSNVWPKSKATAKGGQPRLDSKGRAAAKVAVGSDVSSVLNSSKGNASTTQGPDSPPEPPCDGYGGGRPWWEDYLDIYTQLEGCASMHLIVQVWPLLQHLCRAATNASKQHAHIDSDSGGSESVSPGFSYPIISFSWVKALLHCLLRVQIPGVRKTALRAILGRGTGCEPELVLDLFPCRETTLWLCEELLPLVDSVGFFSANFLGRDKDVGCGANSRALDDTAPPFDINGSSKLISTILYPGALMPSFLTWFVKQLTNCDCEQAGDKREAEEAMTTHFVLSLVRSVCGDGTSSGGAIPGLKSLSAVKWMLRAFADPCVLRLLPRCLGPEQVSAISIYIRSRLASSNGLVRGQILQGLVPLLLRTVDVARVPLRDVLLVIIGDGSDGRGLAVEELRGLLNDPTTRELLRDTSGLYCEREQTVCCAPDHTAIGMSVSGDSSNGLDDLYLPILLLLVADGHQYLADATGGLSLHGSTAQSSSPASIEALEYQCRDRMSTIARLYSSPYLSREVQISAIKFLQGVSWAVLATVEAADIAAASGDNGSGNSSGGSSRQSISMEESPSSSRSRLGLGLVLSVLKSLQLCAGDVVSYMCLALQGALQSSFSDIADQTSSQSTGALISELSTIDAAGEILTAILLLPSLLEVSHLLPLSSIHGAVCKTLTTASELLTSPMASSSGCGSAVAARCVRRLLSAVRRSLAPATMIGGIGTDDWSTLMASVEATLRALIGMKGMSSDAFKTLISRDESYSDGASSSLSFCGGAGQLSPLQRDILAATSSQFGRACAMLSASRWAAVNDALLILSHSNSNNMVRDRSGGEGSPLQGVCGQQFFTVARLELDVCPMEALPDIFSACGIALRTWFSPSIGTSVDDATTRDRSDDKENLSDTMRVDVVSDLLDAAWTVTVGGSNCNDVSAINAFIRMAFSDPVLTGLPHDHTAKYYAELADMGAFRRPHIMQSLVYQLCSVWRANPALCLPFAEEIKRLLVYREPQQDDHNTPDDLDIVLALEGLRGTEASGLCRFAVLIFLEGLCCSVAIDGIAADDRMKSFLDQVVLDMMELNRTKDFVAAAMIGSDAFGRKLRCWQALCVLSSHISEGLLAQLLDTYFLSLVHSCAHGIRVPMEIFGAAVGIRYPDVFLPRLLRELRQFNHSQQTLCSLFVVLGHMFLHVSSSEKYPCSPDIAAPAASTSSSSAQPLLAVHLPSPSSSTYSRSWDIATLRSVVGHLVPWLACAAGLPRNVAQLLIHTLVPCILEADMNAQKTQLGTKDEASSNAGGGSTSLDYLRAIHSYLSENRDSVRSIQKQRSFFQLYSPVRCCTVEGLTSHTMDAAGEILPVHILTVLVDALKELASEPRACWSEGERRGPEAPKGNTAVGAATRAVSDADAGGDDPATATGPIAFQRKHIPFDELQLSLASESLSRSRNAAGRKRQEVVVCATLVEKTTNLAGIARTCEIFAAQQLVLANLSVTRSDAFLGIAVSCEGWLPMAEVPEHKLGLYLRTMKSRGYVILGLEQTDKSENLATAAALPSRCVLLLGKEKEGIPVELLQEVDVFLEIPQFGVTRSLNVHVSAALALWEVTKKNTAFINDSGQDFGEEQV